MSGEIEKEKKGRKKVSEIHREKEDRRREREREGEGSEKFTWCYL